MIHTIGTVPESNRYQPGTLEQFLAWISSLREYQLDIETTVTEFWCDKKMITIQFGDIWGKDQWVIHWLSLTEPEKSQVRKVLHDKSKTKLIHYALFEYVVLRFHGIRLDNIYCTHLGEQVIYGGQGMGKNGLPVGWYSLAGMTMRYLCIDLDKSQQMTFNDNDPLTEDQVVYAADDVKPIGAIRRMQIDKLKIQLSGAPLEMTAALEMEALLSYGDMVYEGMELDTNAWLANLDLVEPVIASAEAACYELMQSDPKLHDKAVELGYINLNDAIEFSWSSPQQVLKLLRILDPSLEGTSQAYLKGLLRREPLHPFQNQLQQLIDKDYQPLGQFVYDFHRDEMIEAGLIRPAGDTQINWNSVPQVLPLLKAIVPRMKSMDEENMNRFPHPIGEKISEYKDTLKLRTTYGEEFINKHLEPDGKIRTTINQVVTTGRASSRNPNMQNIPAKEEVGNRYRNCFIAPMGWSYVSGDYTGQELCIIAYLSGDEVWTTTLQAGQDLHSVCAEMVWPEKWKKVAEPTCEYYFAHVDKDTGVAYPDNSRRKCSCKKHKPMRYDTKSLDFGLAYGMTEFKLAADAKISVPAAKQIMKDYFTTFAKIGRLLDYFGSFGVKHGYIQTIWPFYRKRWFPEWKTVPLVDRSAHLGGISHHWKLGEIERASKNMPIQGTAGDMAKISIILIRWYLDEHNLNGVVKQVMQVHDQDDTITRDDFKDDWALKLRDIMEEAALFLIPNGLVKADVQITPSWSK